MWFQQRDVSATENEKRIPDIFAALHLDVL
jgi:hypothetical protein